MTWTEYAEHLEASLVSLHARVHAGAYRALPSRRKYIPKADGRQRPLGIAAIEGGGGDPDADPKGPAVQGRNRANRRK